jgi:hypothetical protein
MYSSFLSKDEETWICELERMSIIGTEMYQFCLKYQKYVFQISLKKLSIVEFFYRFIFSNILSFEIF